MNSLSRKKPVIRLFTDRLVGLPAEETPKSEIVISEPDQPVQSVEEIQAQIITEYDCKVKRKRGRPKKFRTTAEKQAAYRARKAERAATAALKKALDDEIAFIQHENRDDAGRLHGETSGDDVVSRVERPIGRKIDGGRRIVPSGCNPKTFEDVQRTLTKEKETAYTWMNRQNFYAPAKWDKKDKELFAEKLAENNCLEVDNGFRCEFGDFDSTWRKDVIEHFLKFHQGYIRASIQYCQPHPIELAKKPATCTTADHEHWALVFADRLPVRCRFCKTMIYPLEFRNALTGINENL